MCGSYFTKCTAIVFGDSSVGRLAFRFDAHIAACWYSTNAGRGGIGSPNKPLMRDLIWMLF